MQVIPGNIRATADSVGARERLAKRLAKAASEPAESSIQSAY